MALGASKPTRREEFLCHQALSQRLKRSLYFSGKIIEDAGSLPLMYAASRMFSGRPGRLHSLDVREAALVTHHACISPAALVMALVYLERLALQRSDYLQHTHPKQLFVASTLAASKYLYDDGEEEQVFNDEWAAAAGLEPAQLNAAELDFLTAMDWELFVGPDVFSDMLARAEAAAALSESSRRGWLTYSDLIAIGEQSDLGSTLALLTDALIKVIAVCSVAYLTSVLTLMSSVLLVFPAPAAPEPPTVFVARSPVSAPAAALLDQLTTAAASSGLLLLAMLAPLAGRQASHHAANDHDAPDARQRLQSDGEEGGAGREDGQLEGGAAGDVWRAGGGNETWERLQAALPDRTPWRRDAIEPSPPQQPLQLPSTNRTRRHPADQLPTRRALLPAPVGDRWRWRANDTWPSGGVCPQPALAAVWPAPAMAIVCS